MSGNARIQIFGGFRVSAGTEVDRLRTRKTELLLVFLALNRGEHSREVLIERFWPDDDSDSARQKLRLALNSIRSILGDRLSSNRDTVSLQGVTVDAAEWQHMGSEPGADVKALANGYAVVLPGHLDEYAEELRHFYEGVFQEIMRKLLEGQVSAGATTEAITTARQLLHVEPYNEALHLQLLDLLRNARRPAAIQQHLSLVEELFGILPQRFHAFVGIPNEAKRRKQFFGREIEMEFLAKDLLADREPVLVTLIGPPGVGKTRFASELAHACLDAEVDYVLVELADARTTNEAAALIANKLVANPVGRPMSELSRAASLSAPTLLVLDNWEQLPESAETILEVLTAAGSSLRVLVTSQRPTGSPKEKLFVLHPLSVGSSRQTDANSLPAVRLFLHHMLHVNPEFSPAGDDIKLIMQICQRLDGLPLAIELTARATDLLALDQIRRDLDEGKQVRFSSGRDAGHRHHTVSSAVAWSINLLDEETRELLFGLSVFAGSFTPEAVAAIFGEESLPRLRRLKQRSLLTSIESNAPRFRFLDSVRSALPHEHSFELRERHASYYYRYGEQSQAHKPTGIRNDIDHELGNVEKAVAFLHETGRHVEEANLIRQVQFVWFRLGHYGTAERLMENALEALPDAETHLKAALAGSLGSIGYFTGQMDKALPRYIDAHAFALHTEDEITIAGTLINIGLAFVTLGRYEKARMPLIRAERVMRSVDPPRRHVTVLLLLTDMEFVSGNLEAAFAYLQVAMQKSQSSPDHLPYLALSCFKHADIYWAIGEMELSLSFALRAKELYEEAGEALLRHIEVAARLIWLYCVKRDLQQAATLLKAISEELPRLGEDRSWVQILWASAAYGEATGNFRAAARLSGSAHKSIRNLKFQFLPQIMQREEAILMEAVALHPGEATIGETLSPNEIIRLIASLVEA